MTVFRLAALLMVMILACPAWGQTNGRVALIVGAGAYKNAPRLANTGQDAAGVSAALKRLGFDVETAIDPDRAALEAAVRRFGARATGADAAVFFFAGHALEAGGRNWLLPVQADIQSERDLRFETIEVDAVLEQVENRARTSVIILDSCRDNPFRRTLAAATRGVAVGQGLAPQRAAVGTLIVYATAPGTPALDGTGPNSPFTQSLLRHIETPGLEIRQMIAEVRKDVRTATNGRQIPWDSSALEGEFYLHPVQSRPVAVDSTTELTFWNSVKDSRDPTELQAYLSRYPAGTFAQLAKSRLARLGTAPAVAASNPVATTPGGTTQRAEPLPENAGEAFRAALRDALAKVPEQERAAVLERYPSSNNEKALAISASGAASWRTSALPKDVDAGRQALEACQITTNEACMLIARGNQILPRDGAGKWPVQPQPRVVYQGAFDPTRVPVTYPEWFIRNRVPGRELRIKQYASLPGFKALALHPWGRAFLGEAKTQAEADAAALRDCHDDPDRAGASGACYLYASGDRIVFAERRMSTPPQGERNMALIIQTITRITPDLDRFLREGYARKRGSKAIAMHVPSRRIFEWSEVSSANTAARWALEGCAQSYASPCVLIGVNDELRSPDPASARPWPMDRIAYRGRFDPARLPWNLDENPAVQNYPFLQGGRAIAVRPIGARVSVVGGAASIQDAEREALKRCNVVDDPYPCFVYASGDTVVLPLRRTEAAR